MTDLLDATFADLRRELLRPDQLDPTHTDPFFTFVHEPEQALDIAERIATRWRGALERDGFHVEILSLRELLWSIVDASGRWDTWMETQAMADPAEYDAPNGSMRDVLGDDLNAPPPPRPGVLRTLIQRLQEAPRGSAADRPSGGRRLVLLTDMALLHPWLRVDTMGAALHDKLSCPTVLFYPGTRHGQFRLQFLGLYPEDGAAYRTTILGGL